MLVLTRTEMQAADRRAIDELGIPSLELMERAGEGVALAISELRGEEAGPVVIVCGKGNNGGDGLVAARLLASAGVGVQVWLAAEAEELTGDAAVNWRRLNEEGPGLPGEVGIFPLGEGDVAPGPLAEAWRSGSVVVDALFGTGMTGAPREPGASLIAAMNLSGCPVVAVDIPSGVNADNGSVEGQAVLAAETATMAWPKLGLLLHPGRAHSGAIRVVDIGIGPEAVSARERELELIDHRWALLHLPVRPLDAHKGHFGRVVTVAGSAGMMGAGRLACTSAYRAGAGLVRFAAPESLLAIAHAGPDEIMVTPIPDDGAGCFVPGDLTALREVYAWADVVALGPGLGTAAGTAEFFAGALVSDDEDMSLVVDADGLNLLAAQPDLRDRWTGPVVLTPHPGEAARMLASDTGEVSRDRLGAAAELALKYRATVVLKGAPTIVAEPQNRVALCPLGNPGMATGGTGDVLTGVIAALLGQGLAAFEGAALGVYLHSLAADLAALDLGEWSLMAGDIVEYLPAAFGHIEAFPEHDVLLRGVWE
jgi:NAD(P)H-hydrate epimerase